MDFSDRAIKTEQKNFVRVETNVVQPSCCGLLIPSFLINYWVNTPIYFENGPFCSVISTKRKSHAGHKLDPSIFNLRLRIFPFRIVDVGESKKITAFDEE